MNSSKKYIFRPSASQKLLLILAIVLVVGLFSFTSMQFRPIMKDKRDVLETNLIPDHRNFKLREDRAAYSQQEVAAILGLDNSRRFDNYFKRQSELHVLLTNSDMSDLEQYLIDSNYLENELWKNRVQDAVVQRIAVLNPLSALRLLGGLPTDRQETFVSLVFREWSISNLNEAILYIQSREENFKVIAMKSIVESRSDLSIKERREMASQLDLEWIAIDALARHIPISEIIENPSQDWNSFLSMYGERNLTLNENQFRMVKFISQAWIQRDGLGAVEQLTISFPRQWPFWEVMSSVVKEFLEIDPKLAFDTVVSLREFSVSSSFDLWKLVVAHWAESEPLAALESTLEVKERSIRRQMQRMIVDNWALSDPFGLLNGVRNLPEQLHDLAYARATIALAKEKPLEALDMLNRIHDVDSRNSIVSRVVETWAKQDITSALSWVQNEPSVSHMRNWLRDQALRGLSSEDPQLAFQVALSLPIDGEKGLEVIVIDWVALDDLDMAVSMLSSTRPGSTRLMAYDAVIVRSIIDEDYELALRLFLQKADFGDVQGGRALNYLVAHSPKRLYDSIDKIPSVDLQVEVARNLRQYYKEKDLFTGEQMNRLHGIENRSPTLSTPTQKLLKETVERLQESIN